eukprot:7651655-Pyramimonas_sp.AAC.1
MMHVLLHRAIGKMRRHYPTVQPRVLMGDSSFQWVGRILKFSEILLAAARWYCDWVYKLGLILQAAKSGHVASAVKASPNLSSARLVKLRSHARAGNLGHE